MIDLNLPLAEHSIGKGVTLADRDRRQVEAVGDVADGVDIRHRGFRKAVHRDPAIAGIDGDAGLLQPHIGNIGMAADRKNTWAGAEPETSDRSQGNSLPCLLSLLTMQPVRILMPSFSISLRT